MNRFVYFMIVVLFVSNKIIAQSNFDTGFLPKVVVSKKFSTAIKWVNSLESRTIVYDDKYQFSHSLIDLSSIISFKTNLNQSFNFGYILRFRGQETIHRTFEHYNFIHVASSLKFGHRIAFEQFYQSQKNVRFRARYRFSLEKPLNGERVDVKEFYLKVGNEYLHDFSNLEIRFMPYLGYKVSNTDRVEFGADYRIGEPFMATSENDLWLRVTWYMSM